jgi:hypothetical protein
MGVFGAILVFDIFQYKVLILGGILHDFRILNL